MAVDPLQQPPDHGQPVPSAPDHPFTDPAHNSAGPRGRRRSQLVLPFDGPPLQEPGTAETHAHLRV